MAVFNPVLQNYRSTAPVSEIGKIPPTRYDKPTNTIYPGLGFNVGSTGVMLGQAAEAERQAAAARNAERSNAILGGYDQQIGNSRLLANEASQQLSNDYGGITADASATRERNMARVDQYGNSQRNDLNIKNQQALAAASQSSIRRGLGNTTIQDSLVRGQNFDNTRQQLALEDQLLQNRISTDANLSKDYQNTLQSRAQGMASQRNLNMTNENTMTGGRLKFMEGIQDEGPSFNDVSNFYLQAAASNAPPVNGPIMSNDGVISGDPNMPVKPIVPPVVKPTKPGGGSTGGGKTGGGSTGGGKTGGGSTGGGVTPEQGSRVTSARDKVSKAKLAAANDPTNLEKATAIKNAEAELEAAGKDIGTGWIDYNGQKLTYKDGKLISESSKKATYAELDARYRDDYANWSGNSTSWMGRADYYKWREQGGGGGQGMFPLTPEQINAQKPVNDYLNPAPDPPRVFPLTPEQIEAQKNTYLNGLVR